MHYSNPSFGLAGVGSRIVPNLQESSVPRLKMRTVSPVQNGKVKVETTIPYDPTLNLWSFWSLFLAWNECVQIWQICLYVYFYLHETVGGIILTNEQGESHQSCLHVNLDQTNLSCTLSSFPICKCDPSVWSSYLGVARFFSSKVRVIYFWWRSDEILVG